MPLWDARLACSLKSMLWCNILVFWSVEMNSNLLSCLRHQVGLKMLTSNYLLKVVCVFKCTVIEHCLNTGKSVTALGIAGELWQSGLQYAAACYSASFNCINYFKECLLLEKAPLKSSPWVVPKKKSFHITGQFWGLFRIIFLSLLWHYV